MFSVGVSEIITVPQSSMHSNWREPEQAPHWRDVCAWAYVCTYVFASNDVTNTINPLSYI